MYAQILGNVLSSLGFDLGDGSIAKSYASACFQSAAAGQLALWVDDVAKYAVHVAKSIVSMSPDEAASAIQRAWRSSPRKTAGTLSPRPDREKGQLMPAERAALARSGLLWHACKVTACCAGNLTLSCVGVDR